MILRQGLHSFIARWLQPLDCGGMSHVISSSRNQAGISYTVFKGVLHDTLFALTDRVVVDYSTQIWPGPDVSHRVFIPSSGSRCQYQAATPQPTFYWSAPSLGKTCPVFQFLTLKPHFNTRLKHYAVSSHRGLIRKCIYVDDNESI